MAHESVLMSFLLFDRAILSQVQMNARKMVVVRALRGAGPTMFPSALSAPNGLIFNTFGGGGLLVTDSTKTPMNVVAYYPNTKVYGAGVCGEAVGDKVYFTSGNSASSRDHTFHVGLVCLRLLSV